MLTFNLKREWISIAAIAAMFAISVLLYPMLPEIIPIHWDINGQPDSFAPRLLGAFGMPLGAIVVYVVLYFAPVLDPKRKSLERSADTYILLRTIVMIFFLVMHGLTLYGSTTAEQTLSTAWLMLAAGLMFVLIGNFLPRIRPSWIAGIRTPWTLSSDTIWTRTHRIGGRVFVLGGILIIVAAFLPATAGAVFSVTAVAFVVLVPIAYSYWLWRQDGQRTL